nr:hypothetical protein CFP56_21293 [Quercus suber]
MNHTVYEYNDQDEEGTAVCNVSNNPPGRLKYVSTKMQARNDQVEQRGNFSARRFRKSVNEDIQKREPRLWNRIQVFVRQITDRFANSQDIQ